MSDDFGSIPGARISLFKATLRAISVWRISPNRSRRPIEVIGFSYEEGRNQIAEVAATFATILSVRKPQQQPFLSVSTVNELHRSDVECAMFSVRMNICEAHPLPLFVVRDALLGVDFGNVPGLVLDFSDSRRTAPQDT